LAARGGGAAASGSRHWVHERKVAGRFCAPGGIISPQLQDGGFVEGQNVTVEYRWARGEYGRLPALAKELVDRKVAVLLGIGGDSSALAAKAATSTIPVVFGMGSDPVQAGMVASLNRPGGNVTGVNLLVNELEPKRLGLLNDLVPGSGLIGALLNPKFPPAAQQANELRRPVMLWMPPIGILVPRPGTGSENLIDRLPRKTISSVPKLAKRTPFAFIVNSFLVRTADYAVGHRD